MIVVAQECGANTRKVRGYEHYEEGTLLNLLTYLPVISTIHRIRQRPSLIGDAEDLAAFEERTAEPLISYDAMVKKLKKDGRL